MQLSDSHERTMFWFCAHLAAFVLACLLSDNVCVCSMSCGPLGSFGACPRREKISKLVFGFSPPSWTVSIPFPKRACQTVTRILRASARPNPPDLFWTLTIIKGRIGRYPIFSLRRHPHGRHCRTSSASVRSATGGAHPVTPLG